jgi:hypothetical protein
MRPGKEWAMRMGAKCIDWHAASGEEDGMAKVKIEIEDCFGNAEVLKKLKPGEPFFIVCGQDKLAPATVRFWANEAEKIGTGDAKVANARACATAMMQHRPIKMPD